MRNSLRVLMTISAFYPQVGGGEQQCLRLSKALRAKGVDVAVLTYQEQSEWPERDIVEGVPVTRLKSPRVRLPGMSPLKMWFYLLRHRQEYDLIHNHGIYLITVVSVIAGKLTKKPVVTLFYNTGPRADLKLVRENLPHPLAKLVKRAVLKADSVVAICNAIRKELIQEGVSESKIVSIPYGIDRDIFTQAGKTLRIERRQNLDLPEEATIVMRVGTLMPKKGIYILLEAWQHVAQQNPKAFLVSVGGFPEEIQHLASRWTHRVRFVPNTDDVLLYLQAADIFVLPSFTEGLPNALLEAQSCGLPSVVTDVGGNAEVVEHGENGLVVEAGDIDGLSTAILKLVNDDALRISMGYLAREKSQRYAMPQIVRQYLALYQDLLDNKQW